MHALGTNWRSTLKLTVGIGKMAGSEEIIHMGQNQVVWCEVRFAVSQSNDKTYHSGPKALNTFRTLGVG